MKMDAKFNDDMDMEMDMEHKGMKDKGSKDKEHKYMTMDDVGKELAKDFEDEISDSKKYMYMAKIAEKAKDYNDHHYLMEMAKDEYTHAYFIHDFMVDHNIDIPEEQEEEFNKLRDMMKSLFR